MVKELKKTIGAQNVKKQFARRAKTYNVSANWITDEGLIRAHRKMAGTPAGGNNQALELCCGSGVIGKAILNDGWDVVGVDLTAEMLKLVGNAFPTILANAEKLPFQENRFDLVIMRQALFLTNARKVLREAKRVKKRSGSFILSQTVPFSEADEEWLRRIHLFKQAQMVKFYTENDLENELAAAGLKLEDKTRISVRESITRWMANAPELDKSKREEICSLVLNAPPHYRKTRKVEVCGGEILEDWNWVIFRAK